MSTLFLALLDVVLYVVRIYQFVLLATVVMSWLISFNVVNRRQPVVATIWQILYALTEPVLRPIRRFVPYLGGVDISPVVAFLALFFLERLVLRMIYAGPAQIL